MSSYFFGKMAVLFDPADALKFQRSARASSDSSPARSPAWPVPPGSITS